MVQNVNFSSEKLFLSGSKHFLPIEGKGISNAYKNESATLIIISPHYVYISLYIARFEDMRCTRVRTPRHSRVHYIVLHNQANDIKTCELT